MVIAAVVADDLTGACDSAARFVAAGWEAAVLLDRRHGGHSVAGERDALLAVTTDSRGLPDDAARDATVQAVEAVERLGATRLFLKVDSTMRGSVRGQVAGALQAWGRRFPDAAAVVCPAYPSMGRTVEAGVLLVDGVPLADTAMRHDPVTPPRASALGELLPGSVPFTGLPADGAAGDIRLMTADARTDADLQKLADAIALREAAIPVGSAGLAAAVARTWGTGADAEVDVPGGAPGAPRVLLQITSLNDVSRVQLEVLEEHYGRRAVRITPDLRTLTDAALLAEWFADQAADHDDYDGYDVVVLTPPGERSQVPGASTDLAAHLGSLTARLLRTGRFEVAGFVGGDGARAALAQLNVAALRILGEVEAGIPVSLAIGGDVPGTLFFSKAGGFGGPGSLVSAVARVTASGARRSNA